MGRTMSDWRWQLLKKEFHWWAEKLYRMHAEIAEGRCINEEELRYLEMRVKNLYSSIRVEQLSTDEGETG